MGFGFSRDGFWLFQEWDRWIIASRWSFFLSPLARDGAASPHRRCCPWREWRILIFERDIGETWGLEGVFGWSHFILFSVRFISSYSSILVSHVSCFLFHVSCAPSIHVLFRSTCSYPNSFLLFCSIRFDPIFWIIIFHHMYWYIKKVFNFNNHVHVTSSIISNHLTSPQPPPPLTYLTYLTYLTSPDHVLTSPPLPSLQPALAYLFHLIMYVLTPSTSLHPTNLTLTYLASPHNIPPSQTPPSISPYFPPPPVDHDQRWQKDQFIFTHVRCVL